eukprot:gb/GEZN01015690.1/.p1 GENE.gb/GEZN01015690.1/~~gb/GEZN01015690.1/.p1  ORF type:complete len:143 (+),score=12.56 gb/GEZN01015690.1/:71-499(+)
MMGCKLGEGVCLWPNGGNLLPEPDLVELGDHCAIDSALLVAHINSRGEFILNRLKLGERATMLLSGGEMEARSMLLEHTPIVSGDVATEGTVWQGWPTELQGTELLPCSSASFSGTKSNTSNNSPRNWVRRSFLKNDPSINP